MTAKKQFESLAKAIGEKGKVKKINEPSYGSPYADCNSYFTFVYESEQGKERTVTCHTTSVRKSNMIISLLKQKYNQ